MADVINLRRARKAKARIEREARATENRAQYGRAKQERQAGSAEQQRLERVLDGHHRGEGNREPRKP